MGHPNIDSAKLELLNAEIDGELDPRQRAELARALLADPAICAVRDELRRVGGKLDAIGQVEAPPEFVDSVLRALPTAATPAGRSAPAGARWPAGSWRYAAMLAGVIVAAAIVFRLNGQLAPATEVAGTLAGPRAAEIIDSAAIAGGGASGRASLVRHASGLQLAIDLASGTPVDLQVAGGEHTLTINGLGAGHTVLGLPGFGPEMGAAGQPVILSFSLNGREVARARLESKGAR